MLNAEYAETAEGADKTCRRSEALGTFLRATNSSMLKRAQPYWRLREGKLSSKLEPILSGNLDRA